MRKDFPSGSFHSFYPLLLPHYWGRGAIPYHVFGRCSVSPLTEI